MSRILANFNNYLFALMILYYYDLIGGLCCVYATLASWSDLHEHWPTSLCCRFNLHQYFFFLLVLSRTHLLCVINLKYYYLSSSFFFFLLHYPLLQYFFFLFYYLFVDQSLDCLLQSFFNRQ